MNILDDHFLLCIIYYVFISEANSKHKCKANILGLKSELQQNTQR